MYSPLSIIRDTDLSWATVSSLEQKWAACDFHDGEIDATRCLGGSKRWPMHSLLDLFGKKRNQDTGISLISVSSRRLMPVVFT